VELHRRDIRSKEKDIQIAGLIERIVRLLDEIQSGLLTRALEYRKENTKIVKNIAELDSVLDSKSLGFARAMWNGDVELERILKEKFSASIRCMPLRPELPSDHPCIISGTVSPQNREILIAKAY
jgi:prolyl-tRNA synthetase